jgi:hypothetical protein
MHAIESDGRKHQFDLRLHGRSAGKEFRRSDARDRGLNRRACQTSPDAPAARCDVLLSRLLTDGPELSALKVARPASAAKEVRAQNRGKTAPLCRKRARILAGVTKEGTREDRVLKSPGPIM